MHWSQKYVGIPYKSNNETTRGADCWRLIRMVLRERFHIEIPSLEEYDNPALMEHNATIYDDFDVEWRAPWRELTDADMPQEGDVIVLRILSHTCHVGVVIDANRFLHSWPKIGSCIERFYSPKWYKRVESFWRHESQW